nr:hypothetical protein [Tanacetum cinerariifolium]
MGPLVNKRRRKRGNNKEEANAPPKVLRTDYDASRPAQSTHGGKFLALMGLDVGSLLSTLAAQGPSTATKSVSDPEPLSYANPLLYPEKDIATKCVSDPEPLSHEWRQLVGTLQNEQTPLTLSWERISRLNSGVRAKLPLGFPYRSAQDMVDILEIQNYPNVPVTAALRVSRRP